MSNILPRVLIKRAFADILVEELNANLIEEPFTTGVLEEVQIMMPEMTEEYTRLSLNSSKLVANLSITFDIFSKLNESGVHQLIYQIMKIPASHPKLSKFKLTEIYPSNSFTNYGLSASDGHVEGQVVLTMKYLF
ncbi:hypothetical protein [Pantoea sp. MBLJ3]|uniref:hypothetical protein n=1 Tax=Pantoea sp. MBLJ3 TaxID=1562889 RepID=UPI00057C5BD6|nr:hypothetical protein [Pantoea sp. MBLJ3]